MCRLSEAELNCVRTNIRVMPELRQLEIGMSTNRYLPAMGTAGFERLAVRGYSRVPAPPPKITDRISFDIYGRFVVCKLNYYSRPASVLSYQDVHLLIELKVGVYAGFPTKVQLHHPLADIPQHLALLEKFGGAPDRVRHILYGRMQEPYAIAAGIAEVDDGVVQTAGVPDHRDGAIPECVHLVQTARFHPGRHQDKIGARVNLVAERLIITDIRIVVAPREIADRLEMAFDGWQAASQDEEVHPAAYIIKGVFDSLRDQVRAFIAYQPPDKGNERLPVIQAEPAAKCFLVFLFAFLDGGGVEMVLEIGIGGRVPDDRIDTVEDTAALALFVFQQRFQPLGVDPHFLQIGRADGRHLPGTANPAGQGIEGAFPFQQAPLPHVPLGEVD